jgi:hypothetical protein
MGIYDYNDAKIEQILFNLGESVVYVIPSIDILGLLALQEEGAAFDLYNQNTKDTIDKIVSKISADTTYKLLNNTNLFHPKNEIEYANLIDRINNAIAQLDNFEDWLERDIIVENRDIVGEYYKPEFLNSI